jgi:uncharacterized damage-inducible protein DinB
MKGLVGALAVALVTLPVTAFAQNAPAPAANPYTQSVKVQFGVVKGFITKAAEKVPEELYSYRPTPEVRTFAELFGHVADAFYSMCATAAGEKAPHSGFEKKTAKAELVQALNEASAYCNGVIATMDDKKGADTVPFYFGPTPKLSVLHFNVTHGYEHYGNLVTYMRLKGIVPPSSENTSR